MRNEHGFTLIELIVVTVIIGILAGMVTLTFVGQGEKARKRAAKGDIKNYMTVIEAYALQHNDKWPASLNDLVGGKINYVHEVNKDPWGHDYIYRVTGNTYQIFSAGPDGQAGTADDITSGSTDEEEAKT